MARFMWFILASAAARAATTHAHQEQQHSFSNASAESVCQQLSHRLPSRVIYPSSSAFENATYHFYPTSSEMPVCVFEPRSAAELSKGFKIVGRSSSPFAVESGGHAGNKGFSSTLGVHISLKAFDHIRLSDDRQTLDAGVGQAFDRLFEALDGTGRNVLGARLPGVGLGGFLTGGGYSWETNAHGLAVDQVIEYSLVLPNGTITKASVTKNEDLFFALKGGGNNFGVVYSVKLKTIAAPPQIYGGLRMYPPEQVEAVLDAAYDFFSTSTDLQAGATVGFTAIQGVVSASLWFFYNSSTKPEGVLDRFDAIPHDPAMDGIRTQNYSTFIKVNGGPSDPRVLAHTTPTTRYTRTFLGHFLAQLRYIASQQVAHSGNFVLFNLEGFAPGFLDNSQGGAYPHESTNALWPLLYNFGWTDAKDDDFWNAEIRNTSDVLLARALEEDTFDPIYYPNYAISGTPVEKVYGDNLEELKTIKKRYDPQNIMSRAGGFKIHLP